MEIKYEHDFCSISREAKSSGREKVGEKVYGRTKVGGRTSEMFY